MKQTETFTLGGVLYRRDGRQFYKATGLYDPHGHPVLSRVAEPVYTAARAEWEAQGDGRPPEPVKGEHTATVPSPADVYDVSVSVPDTLTDDEWEIASGQFLAHLPVEKHALRSDWITLTRSNGKIFLAGLPADPDLTKAACDYLSRLVALAKESRRVNRSNKDLPENERYAFRCWLIRLGMVGPKFKETRKTLLENLPGSSSRRDGKRKTEN